jgi:hypothetical protein
VGVEGGREVELKEEGVRVEGGRVVELKVDGGVERRQAAEGES